MRFLDKLNIAIDNFLIRKVSDRKILRCKTCGSILKIDEKGCVICEKCNSRKKHLESLVDSKWKSVEVDGYPSENTTICAMMENNVGVTSFEVFKYTRNFRLTAWKLKKYIIIE